MSTQQHANKRPRNRRPNNNQNGNRNNRGGNNNYKGNRGNYKGRKPQKKLTLWQKILKFFGFNPTKKKQAEHKPQVAKTNTQAKPKPQQQRKSAPPQVVDSSRLYVGNLSYEVTESDLQDLFKGFGDVKNCEVVYNKKTHRSKGFAFVEMYNVEDAKRSVDTLHEQPFMGRNLIVNGARTKEETEANRGAEA